MHELSDSSVESWAPINQILSDNDIPHNLLELQFLWPILAPLSAWCLERSMASQLRALRELQSWVNLRSFGCTPGAQPDKGCIKNCISVWNTVTNSAHAALVVTICGSPANLKPVFTYLTRRRQIGIHDSAKHCFITSYVWNNCRVNIVNLLTYTLKKYLRALGQSIKSTKPYSLSYRDILCCIFFTFHVTISGLSTRRIWTVCRNSLLMPVIRSLPRAQSD